MTAASPDSIQARSADPRKSLRHRIADLIIGLSGWQVQGAPPDVDKCIVIAAPHTANIDGFWMVANGWYWDLTFNWLAKHTIFKKWTAPVLDWLGAIPVDRRAPRGLVDQLADQFAARQSLWLVIPPEGTRARREFWKSGFYHIALQSDVPIALSYLDYGTKTAGFGPCFRLTGDVKADMDRIRSFYANVTARHPERFTEPRLRSEAEEAATAA